MEESLLNILDLRQMIDFSNPMERIVFVLAVFMGLSPEEIAELRMDYRCPEGSYVGEELDRYMEWRSRLVWDDWTGGRLVVFIEDGSLRSFCGDEWMIDIMVTDIGKRFGIRVDFDRLTSCIPFFSVRRNTVICDG